MAPEQKKTSMLSMAIGLPTANSWAYTIGSLYRVRLITDRESIVMATMIIYNF